MSEINESKHTLFTNQAVNFSPLPVNIKSGGNGPLGPFPFPVIVRPVGDPQEVARRSQLQKHLAILQAMGIDDLSALAPMMAQSNVMLPNGLVSARAAALEPTLSLKIFHNAFKKDNQSGKFVQISGSATQLASEPLSVSGQVSGGGGFVKAGAGKGLVQASATSDVPLNICYWAAEWIDLANGTNVILANPNQHLVILTKKLTVGANVTFTYERMPVTAPMVPPKPGTPGTPTTPAAYAAGLRGKNGTPGGNGGMGASFNAAPAIEIWALELNGSPAVDVRGQDGAQGGTGGNGGDGGQGGTGSSGRGTDFWCNDGAGPGGDGGNGANAGDGGPGGNGASGGQFNLYVPQSFLTVFQAGFFVSADGGSAGLGGMAGVPGSAGNGGSVGATGPKGCKSALDGKKPGNPGYQGSAGKQGPMGQAGTRSIPDPIKLIAIGPTEFSDALLKPAIISLSSTRAKEGTMVGFTGKSFGLTDVIQMLGAAGEVVACQTTVVSDTVGSFQVPKVSGGPRSLYVLQADGTLSNMATLYVTPTLDAIENGPRVKPGTVVKIFGTGFETGSRILINGQDVGPTSYLDSHTLQAKIIRPKSGVSPNPAGENVDFSVVLPDLTPSNTIPIVLDTYRIFVFGDSIAWGCGLDESEKFGTLVKDQVEGRNGGGIGVYKDVAAHTGSIIGRGSSGSGPELHGEVSTSFPSILQQVAKYESIPDAKHVDLVLLDGGSNDLPLGNVFNWTACTPAYLESKTREYCGEDMKYLLKVVASTFTTARIVVTGYYIILSSESDQDAGNRFIISILLAGGFTTPAVSPEMRAAIYARCKLFATVANSSLAQAVNEVNTTLGGTPRIFFADPGFSPSNAVFASDPYVFGVNEDLSPQDSMRGTRKEFCDWQAGGTLFCKMASLGHPNAKGATKYAQAIFPFLEGINAKAVLKINGASTQTVDSPGPNHPILIDGSGSVSDSNYFLSIQLSDSSWNRFGPEAMRWLTSADFATYGPINQFDARSFAKNEGFAFTNGQYYRVKLAVGPVWNDTTTLVAIK